MAWSPLQAATWSSARQAPGTVRPAGQIGAGQAQQHLQDIRVGPQPGIVAIGGDEGGRIEDLHRAGVTWLREHIGEERCRAVSTNRLDSYFGGVKWLWYQEEPRLFASTWKILQASSFVIFRLSGQAVIDLPPGYAAPVQHPGARLGSHHLREWACPLRSSPPYTLPPGHRRSGVPPAARESGIPTGVPITSAAGATLPVPASAQGIAGKGQAALMLGTAGNLLFPGAQNRDPRLLHTVHLTGEPLPFGSVLAGTNLSSFASLYDGLLRPRRRICSLAWMPRQPRVPPGAKG